MRKTFAGRKKELGLTLHKQRSRRNPAVTVTDLDFADDLALLMEEMEQAQEVLNKLESEAERVGLYCNAKNTVCQTFNHDSPISIQA